MINQYYNVTQPRPSCVSSLQTFYGLGKAKASRLNSFLLNHPIQTRFAIDFDDVLNSSLGKNILLKVPTGNKIRLFVSHHLRDKILIFCYQAFRLFQNLPTKGQRTKANAGTPSHLNPYLSLRVNLNFYPLLEIAYKRRELMHNERLDELKAYNNALLEKEKMKKSDAKQKSKSSREQYFRKQKSKK